MTTDSFLGGHTVVWATDIPLIAKRNGWRSRKQKLPNADHWKWEMRDAHDPRFNEATHLFTFTRGDQRATLPVSPDYRYPDDPDVFRHAVAVHDAHMRDPDGSRMLLRDLASLLEAPAPDRGSKTTDAESAVPPEYARIVLTQNDKIVDDRFDWEDIEGVQYQYPNQYKNRIVPGREFVYYRGVNRADGTRGQAEYFGYGRIGGTWVDPDTSSLRKSKWKWYCSVEEYIPFAPPLSAKLGDDHIEQLGTSTRLNSNHFRTAVRPLSDEAFERIVSQAGLSPAAPSLGSAAEKIPTDTRLDDPVDLEKLVRRPQEHGSGGGGGAGYSTQPRVVGERAEGLVYDKLCKLYGGTNVRWPARDGEKPGWDVEYDEGGELHRVEVKGTIARSFTSFEITANEWRAAQCHGAGYAIWMVTQCLGTDPQFGIVLDPASRATEGLFGIEPSRFRARF